MRFEAVMVVKMAVLFFWIVMSCELSGVSDYKST
jgi:hypothetical protein